MVTAPPLDQTIADTSVDDGQGIPTRGARRGGRPSRRDALRLGEHILEIATELFLSDGYGATTIEAVAARAGISKRTFYHRFDDKAALFAAVVHRIIAQVRPPAHVALLEGATLRDILRRLAGLMLDAALAPRATALHRLITSESARFPELAQAVTAEGGAREAIRLIADLLGREFHDPRITAAAREFAAEQFLHMVVTIPQRRAIGLGAAMTRAELDAWADDTVGLFLAGCQGWATAQS
jgi:TetR/AcrR family transcriptional repressor of mexJK operon